MSGQAPQLGQDDATFDRNTNAFVAALSALQGQMNSVITWIASTAASVTTNAQTVSDAADTATAAASAATAAAGASAHVPGASYDAFDTVISSMNQQTYRAKTTHAGVNTDPSADAVNWVQVTAGPNPNFDSVTTAGATNTGSFAVTGAASLGGETTLASITETVVALTGTAPVIDLALGTVFTITTTGDTSFTFSNPAPASGASSFTLEVTAGGADALAWPASVAWSGGAAPNAPEAGAASVYMFFTRDGGTTYRGSLAMEFSA
jgi:hypothetical protein